MTEAISLRHDIAPATTVESYPSASLNDDPLLYPGVKPETSFLLDGDGVFEMSVHAADSKLQFELITADGQEHDLNTYLSEQGVPAMEDRIAILGYGANMCPASLNSKFAKVGRPDAQIIPTVYGKLHGYDVVWSGGPGINGNFIANLYTGPETEESAATVGINFLTKEQLLVMHATELSYDLTTVDVEVDGVAVKALVYAGVDDILLKDGKPVAVDAIQAEGRSLESRTTKELLDEMLADEAVVTQLQSEEVLVEQPTAEDYIATCRELGKTTGAKLARKKAVHKVLADLGHSKSYQLPKSDAGMQSWANPSTIPTYGERMQGIAHKDVYVLPSQELLQDKWPNPEKRDLVLRSMGTHLIRISNDLTEKK